MDAKAGEYRRSELPGLDVTISECYHWSIARQLTPFPLRHWNLRNATLHLHSSFFLPTHGSIMLPPRQPRIFAQLSRWQLCCWWPQVITSSKKTLTCPIWSVLSTLHVEWMPMWSFPFPLLLRPKSSARTKSVFSTNSVLGCSTYMYCSSSDNCLCHLLPEY